MGVAAHAISGDQGSGDYGALFGLGTPRIDWEGEWKWEAPGQKRSSLEIAAPPPPPAPFNWPWSTQALNLPRSQPNVVQDDFADLPKQPVDPVETSTDAFKRILATKEHLKVVTDCDLSVILDFLQSTADETESHNFFRLAEWLFSRTMTIHSLQSVLDVMRNKVQLDNLPTEQILQILPTLLRQKCASEVLPLFTLFLNALSPDSARDVVRMVTQSLRPDSTDFASGLYQELTRSWLETVAACAHMQGERSRSTTWAFIYHEIAAHMPVSAFPEHFGPLSKRDLAMVLLRHWVPLHMDSALSSKTISRGDYALRLRSVEKSAQMQSAISDFQSMSWNAEHVNRGEASVSWDAGSTAHDETAMSWDTEVDPDEVDAKKYDTSLTDSLLVMQKHKLPYAEMLDDMLTVLKATKSSTTVWRLFWESFKLRRLGISEQTASGLIDYFTQTGDLNDLRRAFWVFREVKTLSAEQCFNLPLLLIEHGYGTPDRVFTILHRQFVPHQVPQDSRTAANLVLKRAHTDLVELVAYTYAKSSYMNSRTAFRRVWECYCFLRERGAPLSSLMSRAMVRAGISRPMQDHDGYVSLTQIQYIMSVVNMVEGREVASKLDQLMFNTRKTTLNPDGAKFLARRLWWARGREESFANRARWRLRHWNWKQSIPKSRNSAAGDETKRPGEADQEVQAEGVDVMPSSGDVADSTSATFSQMMSGDTESSTLRQEIDERLGNINGDGEASSDASSRVFLDRSPITFVYSDVHSAANPNLISRNRVRPRSRVRSIYTQIPPETIINAK